jgi:hypothetical protein
MRREIAALTILVLMALPLSAQQGPRVEPMKLFLLHTLPDERAKDTVLHAVEVVVGPIAAAKVKTCLMKGFPFNEGTYNRLSRKDVAECDSILEKVDKTFAKRAAEKAKQDAEYDRTHPRKK